MPGAMLTRSDNVSFAYPCPSPRTENSKRKHAAHSLRLKHGHATGLCARLTQPALSAIRLGCTPLPRVSHATLPAVRVSDAAHRTPFRQFTPCINLFVGLTVTRQINEAAPTVTAIQKK